MTTTAGYTIHATRKLLDRVKQPIEEPVQPCTALGNWYATALFWKPQVALFVNERTLLPVFMPLAPARSLARRFPDWLRRVLEAHGLETSFVDIEIRSMGVAHFAKTANRSLVGVTNEYAFLAAEGSRPPGIDDLVGLSRVLADTPMSPAVQAQRDRAWRAGSARARPRQLTPRVGGLARPYLLRAGDPAAWARPHPQGATQALSTANPSSTIHAGQNRP